MNCSRCPDTSDPCSWCLTTKKCCPPSSKEDSSCKCCKPAAADACCCQAKKKKKKKTNKASCCCSSKKEDPCSWCLTTKKCCRPKPETKTKCQCNDEDSEDSDESEEEECCPCCKGSDAKKGQRGRKSNSNKNKNQRGDDADSMSSFEEESRYNTKRKNEPDRDVERIRERNSVRRNLYEANRENAGSIKQRSSEESNNPPVSNKASKNTGVETDKTPSRNRATVTAGRSSASTRPQK